MPVVLVQCNTGRRVTSELAVVFHGEGPAGEAPGMAGGGQGGGGGSFAGRPSVHAHVAHGVCKWFKEFKYKLYTFFSFTLFLNPYY